MPVDLGHLDWCAERGVSYSKLYFAILRNVGLFSTSSALHVPPAEDAAPGMQNPVTSREMIAGVCVVSKRYLAVAAGIDLRNMSKYLKAMEKGGILTVKVDNTKGTTRATTIMLLSEAFVVRRSGADNTSDNKIKTLKTQSKTGEEKEEYMARASQLKLVTDKTLHQLKLKDGTYFAIAESHLAELEQTYGDQVDVDKQLRQAVQWCRDNPEKRKTRRGARKFLSGWLSRATTPRQQKGFGGGQEVELQCKLCNDAMDEPSKSGYCDICIKMQKRK